ncbi:hypothetical protein PMZ80_010729 [Knufia obscura]|uniref:Uncharacterized protein n=2 Tax=Knufia TaxID=430999 RepID=A0AAN8E9J9_9EURO|nr:hypothetical protein PMZ80_010729 [Knufia obscura]KAK5949764.1 hypothetical protein OHC33_009153 [Knufia fluminis]
MRFAILTFLFALLLSLALAAAPQKAIVVSFEDPDTPQSVVDEAMKAIKDAGGVITHEYNLFKGFAAKASETAIEAIHAMGDEYIPTVEQDITYSTQDA